MSIGFKNESYYRPWKPHKSGYDKEREHIKSLPKIKDKKPEATSEADEKTT